MKSNAIIRIVIWSVVILLLGCILLAGLGAGPLLRWNPSSMAATEATIGYTQPEGIIITLTNSLDVYSTPNLDAASTATLGAGNQIRITRQETFGTAQWGFIDQPVTGWIRMAPLQETTPDVTGPASATDPAPTAEPSPATEPAATEPAPTAKEGAASVSAAQITQLSIEWAAGSIQILPGDGDSIQFWEEGGKNAKTMTWSPKGTKLTIAFRQGGLGKGVGLNNTHKKDLTILVPKDWVCQELEVDAASATLTVQNLTIQEVESMPPAVNAAL